MRMPFLLPLVLLSLCLSAPALRAGDDDPAPVAPPQPPVVVQEDALDQLIRGLLADAAPERTQAEAALAHADADSLRALVGRLRQRLDGALARPATVRAEPAQPAGPTVLIESWIVRASAGAAASLAALGRLGERGLRGYDRAELLAQLEQGACPSQEVLTAPRVASFEGQEASISVLNQTSYVQDYDVEVGMGGSQIADPIIGMVADGATLRLKAHRLGAELWVDVHLDLAELVRPIAEASIVLADGLRGGPVRIQLPELLTTRWERTVLLAPAVPVLLASLPAPAAANGERLLVFLEVRSLPQDAATPPLGGK